MAKQPQLVALYKHRTFEFPIWELLLHEECAIPRLAWYSTDICKGHPRPHQQRAENAVPNPLENVADEAVQVGSSSYLMLLLHGLRWTTLVRACLPNSDKVGQ